MSLPSPKNPEEPDLFVHELPTSPSSKKSGTFKVEEVYTTKIGRAADDTHDAAEEPPVDRFQHLEWLFWLQGVGSLLPWNTFITITSYWSFKLIGSPFLGNYTNYITFISTTVQTVTSVLISKYVSRLSFPVRVLLPLSIFLAVFILHTIFVWVPAISGVPFFGFLIACVALLAICMGVEQTALYSVSSYFPGIYTARIVQGSAGGSILVSLINVLTILGSPGIEEAATAFFAVALLTIIACIVSYIYIIKTPHFKYWHRKAELRQMLSTPERSSADEFSSAKGGWSDYFRVFKMAAFLSTSAFLCMVGTLIVFPVVPLSIHPFHTKEDSRFFGDLWVPVYVFLFYGIMDTVGRTIGPYFRLPSKTVFPFVVLRFVFIPLFLFCNGKCITGVDTFIDSLPPNYFKNDAAPVILNLLLGLTNGMSIEAVYYHAPNLVEGEDKVVANSVVTAFLIAGLMVGSFSSFGIKAANCPGDPF